MLTVLRLQHTCHVSQVEKDVEVLLDVPTWEDHSSIDCVRHLLALRCVARSAKSTVLRLQQIHHRLQGMLMHQMHEASLRMLSFFEGMMVLWV